MTTLQEEERKDAAAAKREERARRKAEKAAAPHIEGWGGIVRVIQGLWVDGYRITRVTLRGVWYSSTDMLIVLCADTDEGPKVAFHKCRDIDTLWVELRRRIDSGKLEWRDDEYG